MAFPKITRRKVFALAGGSSIASGQSTLGAIPYSQTLVEIAAGVTPTSYAIPSHLTAGGVFLERYGGSNSATAATNSTAFANALLVAGQLDLPIFIAPGVLSGNSVHHG